MKRPLNAQKSSQLEISFNFLNKSIPVYAETLLVEGVSHSTIDGHIISETAKSAAVKKGSGVVIGDLFVGLTTSCEYSFSFPEIVY